MFKDSDAEKIQKKIGYHFNNRRLLEQAFTRRSYSVAHGGENNEVLEFFGDRILDFAVIMDFYNLYGRVNNKGYYVSSKNVGNLCREDFALVKNTHLAERIVNLGLTKYLNVQKANEKCAMKNKADLFEAVLGAVAVDSDWDFNKISRVFHAMMYSHEAAPVVAEGHISVNYVDLFETEAWKYGIIKTSNQYEDNGSAIECSFVMMLNGTCCKVCGQGQSNFLAKTNAFETGYKIIRLWIGHEFVPEMEFGEQLYFLYRQNFIAKPCFRYEVFSDDSESNGEVWRCFGSLKDSDVEFMCEADTRYEAQEEVCRAILGNVLGLEAKAEDETEPVCHGQGLLKYILSKYGNMA